MFLCVNKVDTPIRVSRKSLFVSHNFLLWSITSAEWTPVGQEWIISIIYAPEISIKAVSVEGVETLDMDLIFSK